MEAAVTAPRAGTVTRIALSGVAQVEGGDLICVMAVGDINDAVRARFHHADDGRLHPDDRDGTGDVQDRICVDSVDDVPRAVQSCAQSRNA